MPTRCRFPSRRPSSAILTILSVLATAAGPVHASPVPSLPFLYPSLGSGRSLPFHKTLIPRSTGKLHRSSSDLPDKYEVRDGVWHRVAVWSLYGFTVCQNCPKNESTTTALETNLHPSSPQPSTVPAYDIRDTLPPGWRPTNSPASTHINLVLGLSIVLAVIICLLIATCVHQRKADSRRCNRDIEKRKRRGHQSQLSVDTESILKEARVKQKLWARATARWKSHARYAARHRRGRRTPSRSMQSLQPLDESPPPNPREVPPSPTSLRSPNILPLDVPPRLQSSSEEQQSSLPRPCPSQNSSPSLSISSLPAYDRRFPPSPIPLEHDCQHRSSCSSSPSVRPIGNPTFIDSAHVATDDKAVLARMANFMSSPPIDDTDPSSVVGISYPEVSAPLWSDTDEDFVAFSGSSFYSGDDPTKSHCPQFSELLPPPPPRNKLVASYDFDPYVSDASAPLSWIEPSPLPLEELDMAPSAPPLSWLHEVQTDDTIPENVLSSREEEFGEGSSQQDISVTDPERTPYSPCSMEAHTISSG